MSERGTSSSSSSYLQRRVLLEEKVISRLRDGSLFLSLLLTPPHYSNMKRLLHLTTLPQACLSLLICGVALLVTMMTLSSHALPAAPDMPTTNTNADLGTLLTPGVDIGDPHNTATLNASTHLLAREGEDAEKDTIAEAVRLINECELQQRYDTAPPGA